MIVDLVLEGRLEEPVARKIVEYCNHEVGDCFKQDGASTLKKNAYKFHAITRKGNAVFVLTDYMDTKCACIVEARHAYLTQYVAQPDDKYLLRFAVAELESWLLADRHGIANFLRVPVVRIPGQPDSEADPKKTLVSIANKSRNQDIKRGIVPDAKHRGVVAPLYFPTMQSFVQESWDIEAAQDVSPSLRRCIARLKEL